MKLPFCRTALLAAALGVPGGRLQAAPPIRACCRRHGNSRGRFTTRDARRDDFPATVAAEIGTVLPATGRRPQPGRRRFVYRRLKHRATMYATDETGTALHRC